MLNFRNCYECTRWMVHHTLISLVGIYCFYNLIPNETDADFDWGWFRDVLRSEPLTTKVRHTESYPFVMHVFEGHVCWFGNWKCFWNCLSLFTALYWVTFFSYVFHFRMLFPYILSDDPILKLCYTVYGWCCKVLWKNTQLLNCFRVPQQVERAFNSAPQCLDRN